MREVEFNGKKYREDLLQEIMRVDLKRYHQQLPESKRDEFNDIMKDFLTHMEYLDMFNVRMEDFNRNIQQTQGFYLPKDAISQYGMLLVQDRRNREGHMSTGTRKRAENRAIEREAFRMSGEEFLKEMKTFFSKRS